MRKRQWHVHALTPRRDRQAPVAEGDDRFDETTDVRPELVSDAACGPARPHVGCRDRRAVGKTCVFAQGDDPGTAVRLELPGRCQAWTNTTVAIRPDERLVELTEQQPLALVRR